MEILFRASSIGKLMTKPRSKNETLSETTKNYLMEVFIGLKYGRYKDISNKYLIKGNEVEEESLTLLSQVTKKLYLKNERTFSDSHFIGTPDIIDYDTIIDIKSSYDIFTFFDAKNNEVNKDYYYQLHAYMHLTGKSKAKLVYCLVNNTYQAIQDLKKREYYKYDCNEDSKEYIKKCKEIERNNIFDIKEFESHHPYFEWHNDVLDFDVPKEERVHVIEFDKSDSDIKKMQDKVILSREYLSLKYGV